MSNIFKFPGQEEHPRPDNVVSFPDAAQREAVKPVRRGARQMHQVRPSHANPRYRLKLGQWCMVSVSVLFMVVRHVAAIALQLSITIPLAVLAGFRWLICFFSMLALIGTWIFSSVMARHLTEAQHSHVYAIYFIGWGLFILATVAQPLANWVTEKRIAFRLFGLKGD